MIVGSTAAKYWSADFRKDKKSDLDIWTSEKPKSTCKGIDLVVMPKDIMDSFEGASKSVGLATLNDLATIKLSHLPYDIFWFKHKSDFLVLTQKYGAIINEKLLEKLSVYWKEKFGNKSYLSLYKTKDKFFDDYVQKKYDHDWLHEQVALYDEPLYKKCLKDGEQVAIDKLKFEALTFEEQLQMFREEVSVIALERWVIPSNFKIAYQEAYSKSLHKTVTALTKGWASEFMCRNIDKLNRHNYNMIFNVVNSLKENGNGME